MAFISTNDTNCFYSFKFQFNVSDFQFFIQFERYKFDVFPLPSKNKLLRIKLSNMDELLMSNDG
jgi:hypothetical protein